MLEKLRTFLDGRNPRGRERATRGEIGWGGAKVFSGIVLDEHNPDLKGRLALQTAERMRRTSGQVRAVGADGRIEAPSGGFDDR